jgi:UDP-GlcNAc:undecaprenyl-phosphate GlcNAc-1-phosphate transferase
MINFILIFILNISLVLFHKKISRFYNLYDKPDGLRKKHKGSIPKTGGLIIALNFLLILILYFKYFEISYLFIILAFFFGYLDDKYNIKPLYKLLSLFIIISINIIIEKEIQISVLKFDIIKNIFLDNHVLKIFFTIFCILAFINALNMFDGLNLQAGAYVIFIFLVLFFQSKNILYVYFIISLISFLILNLNNKSFLGDSGSILLGYLISFFILKEYTINNILNCESILLIMFLPGIDMLRLFVERILNRNNPLGGDRNHIHHLLLHKFNKQVTALLIISLAIFPYLASFLFGKLIIITFSTLIYFWIYYSSKNSI